MRIVRLEISGIKGIKDKITFDFENSTIKKTVFDEPSIKAVYGTNGSGKTAFMTAVDIYKKVCTDGFYLYDADNSVSLKNLINKQKKLFEITVYFVAEWPYTYVHRIQINADSEKPFIALEEISRIVGKTINGKTETLLRIEKSNCVLYKKVSKGLEKKADELVIDSINKLSEYRSVVSLFSDNLFRSGLLGLGFDNKEGFVNYKSTFIAIFNIRRLTEEIVVYLADSDKHIEMTAGSFIKYADYLKKTIQEPNSAYMERNEIIVSKSQIKAFEKHVQKVFKFIKLFKPSLESISLIKKSDEDKIRCRMEMNYSDCSVDFEYESAGIKCLVSMFDCLERASNGGIGFIDEMDVNINEIYLEKLCSYFLRYGKGQLCVTVHNTAPMKILQKGKHSLDFINCSQEVVSWIKNGAKSSKNDFKDGLIPGIPFNVNDFDFIGVFEEA